MLFLGGDVMDADGQLAAAQVAAGTGARLMSETFPARAARGAGLPDVQRLPYPPEMAIAALAGTKHLVLAGAPSPVHFFGYPDVPGHPVPEGCTVHVLSAPGEDGVAALQALAEARRAGRRAGGAGGVAAGAADRRADAAGDGGRRRRAAAGERDPRRRGAHVGRRPAPS